MPKKTQLFTQNPAFSWPSSKLGFGTWQFGGANFIQGKPMGWGDFDRQEAIESIRLAYKEGIRFFDTADSYGRGLSEEILGEALQPFDRSSYFLCTKFGNKEIEKDTFIQDFSPEWLAQALANSLERLKTDYVDVFLFHSPPDDLPWDKYPTTLLETFIKEGFIRQFGVSSKSVYGAKKVMDSGFGSVVEVIYNLLDRRAEEFLFNHPRLEAYNIIARVPMASGFLSAKYLTEEPVFREDEYRNFMTERDRSWFLEQVRALAFLDTKEQSLSEAALRFCLQQKGVSVLIPGMRNEVQVQKNKQALQTAALSEDTLLAIKKAVPDVPHWWKPA